MCLRDVKEMTAKKKGGQKLIVVIDYIATHLIYAIGSQFHSLSALPFYHLLHLVIGNDGSLFGLLHGTATNQGRRN
jgi:hypothetical protein